MKRLRTTGIEANFFSLKKVYLVSFLKSSTGMVFSGRVMEYVMYFGKACVYTSTHPPLF